MGEEKSIWKYFVLCESDDSKVTCQVCNEKVSRGGGKRKAHGTTNLRKYLQQHHKEKYKELEVEECEQTLQLWLISQLWLALLFVHLSCTIIKAGQVTDPIIVVKNLCKLLYTIKV